MLSVCLSVCLSVRLSVRLSRAYFFLRIVLGTWALTRTENEIPIVKIGKLQGRTQLQERPHSGRPLNGRTLLFMMQVMLRSYAIKRFYREANDKYKAV